MKNLKVGFIALCGLVFAFSACKKDKDATPNNSFVIGNSNYAANLAFADESASAQESGLTLTNISSTNQTVQHLNYVNFSFKTATIPASGTYTYKAVTGAGYDATKYFSYIECGADLSYNASTGTTSGTLNYDTDKYDGTGSTITISTSGSTYTFVYDLKFTKDGTTTEVKGQYSGMVTK